MNKIRSKNAIIAICALVYFVSYFTRKDFAAAMAAMLEAEVIEKSIGGLIGTMLFIFYGVGQLVSGYLGDKIKPKYLIVFGLATTALCNLVMPLVPGGVMIAVWGLNGFAQAMLWPPIVKILSNYLNHEKFVTANLIVTSAAHVSTILLYIYVPICISFMSWETVFFTASALAAVSIVAFVVSLAIIIPKDAEVLPASTRKAQNGGALCEPISKIVFSTGLAFIFICIIMCGFLRDGIESLLPTLYSEAFNRDASESILVSGALPVFSIVSVTFVRAIHKSKLFNNEIRGAAILFLFSAILCIPLAILIGKDNAAARIICLSLTVLVCAAMHGVNFLLISCVPGRFAVFGRSSTVSGLTNAFVYIGAAVSTYGIALVSAHLGWSLTICTWIAVAFVGVIFAIPAYRKYTSFIYAENQ